MAKNDQFEQFRQATLSGGPSLRDLASHRAKGQDRAESTPSSGRRAPWGQMNSGAKATSINIPAEIYDKLCAIRYEQKTRFIDLYIEALEDLCRKYGK